MSGFGPAAGAGGPVLSVACAWQPPCQNVITYVRRPRVACRRCTHRYPTCIVARACVGPKSLSMPLHAPPAVCNNVRPGRMLRRLYLMWRWWRRRDLDALLRASLEPRAAAAMPELRGYSRFKAAVAGQLDSPVSVLQPLLVDATLHGVKSAAMQHQAAQSRGAAGGWACLLFARHQPLAGMIAASSAPQPRDPWSALFTGRHLEHVRACVRARARARTRERADVWCRPLHCTRETL